MAISPRSYKKCGILKSLSFLIKLAASDVLRAWDTEEVRDREEWRCLLGRGEGKVGKVTIEFAVLKERSMLLSLTHCVLWAKPLPLWTSLPPFLYKAGVFPAQQHSCRRFKDRQGSRDGVRPVSDRLCWLQIRQVKRRLWCVINRCWKGVWAGLRPAFPCARWERCRENGCRLCGHGLGGLTGQSQKGRLSLRLAHPMLRHGAGAPRPTPRPPATLRSFLPRTAARVADRRLCLRH